MFRSARARDRLCGPYVRRQVGELVGESYGAHPIGGAGGKAGGRPTVESFVLLLNPAWVPHALERLRGLGFEIEETRLVEVGNDRDLAALEAVGDLFNVTFLYYLLFLAVLSSAGAVRSFFLRGKEWRDKEKELTT